MFCCTNSRTKENKTQEKKVVKLKSFGSLEINDEGFISKDVPQIQKLQTLTSSRVHHDQNTQSRSNSKGTRNLEQLIQPVTQIHPKKTPFQSFKKKQTKFIALKQGYQLLVTQLIT